MKYGSIYRKYTRLRCNIALSWLLTKFHHIPPLQTARWRRKEGDRPAHNRFLLTWFRHTCVYIGSNRVSFDLLFITHCGLSLLKCPECCPTSLANSSFLGSSSILWFFETRNHHQINTSYSIGMQGTSLQHHCHWPPIWSPGRFESSSDCAGLLCATNCITPFSKSKTPESFSARSWRDFPSLGADVRVLY